MKRALEEWLQARENLHVQYQSEIHKLKTQLDDLQQWSETSDQKKDTVDRNLDRIFEGFNRLIGVLDRRTLL